MSVPASLDELPEQIAGFGPHAYLVTVRDGGRPKVTSVSVIWQETRLRAGAGRRRPCCT